jgi:hypothetical protein
VGGGGLGLGEGGGIWAAGVGIPKEPHTGRKESNNLLAHVF